MTEWCPAFVPWSCWGVVDPEMNRCDVCGCRAEDHPVSTAARADQLSDSYACGLDGVHHFSGGAMTCECGSEAAPLALTKAGA